MRTRIRVYALVISILIGASSSCSHSSHGTFQKRSLSSDEPDSEIISTWVQWGENSQLIARAITQSSQCPALTINHATLPMQTRASANDQRFPVKVCEVAVPDAAKTHPSPHLSVNGIDLPVPNPTPNRIVVIGDTGCRMKKQKTAPSEFQKCNDPAFWPFLTISKSAAEFKPDLVIHVGDYHYRESACPSDDPGCQGAAVGDRWESWKQDFFAPAAPLLKAAPWVFVRGNHEACNHGGRGWFRFLDSRPKPEHCQDRTDPYQALQNPDLRVIDDQDSNHLVPSLKKLDRTSLARTWLLMHRPFLIPGEDDDAPAHMTPSLPEGLTDAGVISAVFAGHIHTSELKWFPDTRPIEFISGNSGSSLAIPDGVRGPTTATQNNDHSSWRYFDFGFLTLERIDATQWSVTARDRQGKPMINCTLSEKAQEKSMLSCSVHQ